MSSLDYLRGDLEIIPRFKGLSSVEAYKLNRKNNHKTREKQLDYKLIGLKNSLRIIENCRKLRNDLIINMKERGLSIYEIAIIMNTCKSKVSNILKGEFVKQNI